LRDRKPNYKGNDCMRIEKLRRSGDSTRARVSARVIWEESSREPQEYYFETLDEFADGMTANPHAFLVPCTIAALRHSEKRVAIDATICPELKAGLTDAIRLLQFWWTGKPRPAVTIEARGTGTSKPQTIPGAAFCFTGGIDSLTVLRSNRMDFLPHHAGYLRDGVLVFGLEVQRLDAFEHVADVLRRCATAAGISMVPVYTNIQDLDKDWTFWQNEFEAAVLASVGHALHTRIASLSIGASFDYTTLHPHGSHPLLDPNYGASDLRIRHEGIWLTRLQKTALLAKWPLALKALHVCNHYETYRPGLINCGTCEKCLRTLTALLVVGVLDDAVTFARRDVTPELIAAHASLNDTSAPFWNELLPPLRQQGRDDLADAVGHALARYRNEVGWAGALRRVDRVHLHGSLRSMKRTLAGIAQPAAASH
jgi:hypothetical protein